MFKAFDDSSRRETRYLTLDWIEIVSWSEEEEDEEEMEETDNRALDFSDQASRGVKSDFGSEESCWMS